MAPNKSSDGFPVFEPLPLLRSPHAQTIAAMILPWGPERFPSLQRFVDLPDGDRLAVVTSVPPGWSSGERTIVLVHGLCGCHRSPYMSRLAGKLYRSGLRVVRVNLRGCGSGAGLAQHPYHSGRSEDIREVLNWLGRELPASPVTLLGFSLGGNIVLKLAGEDGENPTACLDSVAAVSAPIDLVACSRLIGQPQNRFYQAYFVRRLMNHLRELLAFFPDQPTPALSDRATLRMFDDRYTAPRSGFKNADDYYQRASSAPLIPRIEIPTLLLVARDDPFIASTPYEQLPQRHSLSLCVTDYGGHLGFLARPTLGASVRWMDERLLAWVRGP